MPGEIDFATDLPWAGRIEETLSRDASATAERIEELASQEGSRVGILAAKEDFFRQHAIALYETLTEDCIVPRRLADIVYAAAERVPWLLPTREAIAAERKLDRQVSKRGLEIDQALLAAHILADERCGLHLVHAMLRPTAEAERLLPEFRRTGAITLPGARVERRDRIGHVTMSNPGCLNAEDDSTVSGLETAIDLVLLDDGIDAGVLRGDVLRHGKYAGRRVFNAGINLTELYRGHISFVEFILERELGLMNKLYRGLWVSENHAEQFEDTREKPWLAAVDAFAIGGGCQLLCVVDRVIADEGAYFTLPASKEGFIPGAVPLRLPRLIGARNAREAIFAEKTFPMHEGIGALICDEVVPPEEMDAAVERNARALLRGGAVSTVANRKALRVGEEPLSTFRRYMATYARQQAFCFYDPALLAHIEQQ